MNNTKDIISVYPLSPYYKEAMQWLIANWYCQDSELVSLVIDWSDHWNDKWSILFSKSQRNRIEIIGDWIEEHGGDRRWATCFIPVKDR